VNYLSQLNAGLQLLMSQLFSGRVKQFFYTFYWNYMLVPLRHIFIKNRPIMLANGIIATLSGIIFHLKLISKPNAKN